MLSIFLLFLLGVFFKFSKFLKTQTIRDLKKIVANVTLPALLFKGFSGIDFQKEYLLIVILMFCIPLCIFLLARPLKKVIKIKSPYLPHLLGGFEMGMLGYALFLTIFGQENLPVIAVIDLGQVLFVFFVLIPSLGQLKSGKNSIKEISKTFIKSPVIIAIISGLIIGLINIDITQIEIIDILGSLTMPLIMISLGYEIEFKKEGFLLALKTVIFRKTLLFISALLVNKFIISSFLGLPIIFEYGVLVMFLMPPPFVVSIFMDQDDHKNLGYVTNTLSLSIVVSVIMILTLNLLLF
ncbi:MAG: permease [Spirochaetaceae bacterium]